MAVNFSKNQDEITRAWREVVDSSSHQKWALFGYEGATNVIKLMATGSGGLDELVDEFNCSLIQYAFCRVIDESLGLNRLLLINWQGDSAPLSRKGLCASHVGDVSNYFKGCAQTITIRNDDEATKEHLMEQVLKSSASKLGLSRISSQTSTASKADSFNANIRTHNETIDSSSVDTSVSSSTTPLAPTPSSVYAKVDIGSDIAASRKSFWQRQEEEERERLAEEKRRAAEKQAQFERERKQREELEAKKLAETIRQREQLIDATKKADKQSPSANQPSSIVSTTTAADLSDDDGRVGRRSELIRLERNQETQSLITKGLIKNKRAIFEQAQQQQQQQQQQQPTLSRRASGAIITKRVNAFKSLDVSSNSNLDNTNDISTNVVGKLSNSFAKQVNVNSDDGADSSSVTNESSRQAANASTTPVKREVEPVTLVRESESSPSQSPPSVVGTTSEWETTNLDESSKNTSLSTQSQKANENGAEKAADEAQDVNGNSENSFSKKSPIKEKTEQTNDEIITNEQLIMNGKNSNIKAIALYDYQAADNTEISFDPDDQIGHIQKVDPGWWHGQVLTGTYKGKIGLFPANYVQEL